VGKMEEHVPSSSSASTGWRGAISMLPARSVRSGDTASAAAAEADDNAHPRPESSAPTHKHPHLHEHEKAHQTPSQSLARARAVCVRARAKDDYERCCTVGKPVFRHCAGAGAGAVGVAVGERKRTAPTRGWWCRVSVVFYVTRVYFFLLGAETWCK
jgi:hypothetical protein